MNAILSDNLPLTVLTNVKTVVLSRASLSAQQKRSFAITVRAGKGKDRFVPLAPVAVEPLEAHLARIRRIFDHDRQEPVPGVALPDGLERKYPRAGEQWPWIWLWPDDHLSVDPRSRVERRHPVIDRAFQASHPLTTQIQIIFNSCAAAAVVRPLKAVGNGL